jgi:hypothetical protein
MRNVVMFNRAKVGMFAAALLGWSLAVVEPSAAGTNATVRLAWHAVPAARVVGYYVYYGTASHSYTLRLAAGRATTMNIGGLVEGETYFFAVASYNAAGVESKFSDEASWVAMVPIRIVPSTYHGLFQEPEQVRQYSSGAFTVTTTASGRYSGYLQVGGARYPFHGQLGSQGQASQAVAHQGAATLDVTLNLSNGTPAAQISGTVSNGSWVANLTGDRYSYNAGLNPAPFQGSYTLVFAGPGQNDSTVPAGYGAGWAHVDASGWVHSAASLADGTKFSLSVPLSPRATWPLYAPLYAGKGSTFSWLSFTNRPTDDFNGLASWIKPADPRSRYYPAGFTNEWQALGSAYIPRSAPGPASMGLSISGGNEGAGFTNLLAISPSGHVTDGTNRLTLAFSRATGGFRGNLRDPSSGKALPLSGAMFQKTGTGYGFLLGPSQSSSVLLTP